MSALDEEEGAPVSEQQFTGPLARLFGTGTGDGAAEVRGILLPPSAALPVPPATDRAVWTSVDSVTAHDLVARAERDLGIPWPLPLASQAVRVHRDGDRDAWETLAFERQRRL